MESDNKAKTTTASVIGLVVTFLLSGFIGYFLMELIGNQSNNSSVKSSEEIVVKKPDPLKVTIKKKAYLEENGMYSIELGNNWQSGGTVIYDLYYPWDTTNVVATSRTGIFQNVSPIEGGFYYVRAKVRGESVVSNLFKLNGFVIPGPIEKPNPFKDLTLSAQNVISNQENVYSFYIPYSDKDGNTRFVLYKSKNGSDKEKTDYSNLDGNFKKVSVERGFDYYVRLESEIDGNQIYSDFFKIDELKWVNPKPSITKLTTTEVENLINERKSLLNNKNFSNQARVVISNANETSMNWKTLDNFIQNRFAWKSVKVEDVKYGNDNKVTEIMIFVNY